MRGQRGQASILIAIIFQILFIFFAMVINVGLLVHDKINLQNSTDIAAYYAAMKQAEVLNAMAQLNYQIHQTWKLFNWRLWVLADAGRNQDYISPGGTSSSGADSVAIWKGNASMPIVCVSSPIWRDVKTKNENLCAKTDLILKNLNPPGLIGAQGVFAPVFQSFINGISGQNSLFQDDFRNTGLLNYEMAATFLASYKIAAARRRFAIHALQNLLIARQDDFNDLTGKSVKTTTEVTLLNNLTASNKANGGPEFVFQNGLGGQPFMVPIEVRVFLSYLDYKIDSGTTSTQVQQINTYSQEPGGQQLADEASIFWYSDYVAGSELETAQQFTQEPDNFDNSNLKAYYSLVGFEKNPWVLAYVKVSATTHPKMLFSPLANSSPITLTAESYAMPFGGKMGPWYFDSWPNTAGNSQAGNRIEGALTVHAPRRDEVATSVTTALPNYSRFPGDTLGLSSSLARKIGLLEIEANTPGYADYIRQTNSIVDPNADPIVASPPNVQAIPALRNAEKGAVAPDLFDATYYSVTYDFPTRYPASVNLFTNYCSLNSVPSCFDLGNELPQAIQGASASPPAVSSIDDIFFKANPPPGPAIKPFWALTAPEHLNTSWSQGDPGEYDATQAAISVGKTWGNSTDKPAGGRAGYSVKLVSKYFLQRKDLLLGGTASKGGIANPPQ